MAVSDRSIPFRRPASPADAAFIAAVQAEIAALVARRREQTRSPEGYEEIDLPPESGSVAK